MLLKEGSGRMNANYKAIHETVVRDVIEMINAAKDASEGGIEGLANLRKNSNYQRSINSATSDMVLVFPVICSRGVQLENASMVTKAIERQCASLLQILFSAAQVTDETDARNFVKQFHTNIKGTGMNVDDFIMAMDDITESASFKGIPIDRARIRAIEEDLKENTNYYLPNDASAHSLNEYKVYPATGLYRNNRVMLEANDNTDDDVKSRLIKDELNRSQINKANTGAAKDLSGIAKDKSAIDKEWGDRLKSGEDILRNQLMDSDIKKANELQPTMMTINFISRNENGKPITVNNVIVGVKAKLYPVDSKEIVSRIKLKTADRNVFLNFIKATTRETSFWKDFIFAIDNAKIDALSNSRRGSSSKLWKILDRRSIKSHLRKSLGQRNDATAISTLVVSQEEVDYIRRMETIDLDNVSIARSLMESMNLMGIVIVDETLEVAKFLWDTGDDNFENISFNHLEREASDNSYKKIVNLMTKVVR